MKRILIIALLACMSTQAAWAQTPAATSNGKTGEAVPAPHLIDRFKELAGEWSASGLDGNSAPDARMRYEVTAGGSTVVETLFPGTPHEMRTVYAKDGADVVLTHFCASGHHPRMRAKSSNDGTLVFAYDGALNFDPAKDDHMHDATFTFAGPDEIRSRWTFWRGGKPAGHVADFHARRVSPQP